MSADNWTECPKCEIKFRKEQQEELTRANDAYGKVPASEYEEMIDKARTKLAGLPDSTFRENYEIGIMGIDFEIVYSGRCTECGFAYKFNFHKKLELE